MIYMAKSPPQSCEFLTLMKNNGNNMIAMNKTKRFCLPKSVLNVMIKLIYFQKYEKKRRPIYYQAIFTIFNPAKHFDHDKTF